jgi:repressor LexA
MHLPLRWVAVSAGAAVAESDGVHLALAPTSKPDGPYPELAYAVRDLLASASPPMSLRAAANKTMGAVSHDTIKRLVNGERVGMEKLDALAIAFGKHPNHLRRPAGYPPKVGWDEAVGAESANGVSIALPATTPPDVIAAMQTLTEALATNRRPGVLVTPMEETTRLPVIGRIAAGTPILSEENIEEFVSVPTRWLPRHEEPRQCYALTVRGDSMVGADIKDGDTLAVRMVETAEDGQVVVARIDETVTVKRLRMLLDETNILRKRGYLFSDPEDYMDPIPLGPDAAIIGVPVGYLRQKPPSWG